MYWLAGASDGAKNVLSGPLFGILVGIQCNKPPSSLYFFFWIQLNNSGTLRLTRIPKNRPCTAPSTSCRRNQLRTCTHAQWSRLVTGCLLHMTATVYGTGTGSAISESFVLVNILLIRACRLKHCA